MTPGKPAAGQQQAAPAIPGCVPGDEVYLHHPNGPVIARIVAHGEHGITADVGGRQHKVKWDKVLGHRRRAAVDMHVEDEGEDGMVVRDQPGKRHYVAIPPEAREERMVVKSHTGGARMLVFMKALKPADKGEPAGGWVENAKAPTTRGHHVAFHHGDYTGRGQVQAAGKDGVTVQDSAGARHAIPHDAVTHRWEGEGKPDAGPGEDSDKSGNEQVDALRQFLAALVKGAPDEVVQWVEQFVAKQQPTVNKNPPERMGDDA